MKKLLFVLPILSFMFMSSVNATEVLFGGVVNSNDYRNRNTLNLLEEFSNNTNLARFLSLYSSNIDDKLTHDVLVNENFTLDLYSNSHPSNFLSVFNREDLFYFSIGSRSYGRNENALVNKCDELGCSYVFMYHDSLIFDNDFISWYQTGGTHQYFLFYDNDFNYLDFYSVETRYTGLYYYIDLVNKTNGVVDITSLLNIVFHHTNNHFSNMGGKNVALNYLYDGNSWNTLNSNVGKGSLWNWWSRVWSFNVNKSVSEFYDEYQVLSDDYYNQLIISTQESGVFFLDSELNTALSDSLPNDFTSISLNDYQYGVYFIPKNACSDISDFDVYYYSSLDRQQVAYYSGLSSNDNDVLYTYYFNVPKIDTMYYFSFIDGQSITFDNLFSSYFYLYKEFSVADMYIYYNPSCYTLSSASSNSNVYYTRNDTTYTIPSAVTNKLVKTKSSNYSNTTTSYNDNLSYNNSSSSASSSSSALGDIVKGGLNNITGIYDTIQATLSMVTAFLTALPPEIYGAFLGFFGLGLIILILKLFL